jgi:uncharacterized RDD family membrane protein YckC
MNAMSVSPAPSYAGFWRRFGAAAIDGFVLAFPNLAMQSSGFVKDSLAGAMLASIGIGWAYFALMHSSRWQATLGKRAFRIKVTDVAGGRIGFGRATARYFATFVSTVILFFGYLMAAFTRQRQALHDKIAGTLVVSAGTVPGALPADGFVAHIPWKMKAAIAALVIAPALVFSAQPLVEDLFAGHDVALESAAPVAGPGDEIEYAIYEVPFFRGDPHLVKEGTRKYAHAEVQTVPGPAPGQADEQKILQIGNGLAIRTALYREERIDGFGLVLSRRGEGFSWEWFDRQGEDVFNKRQGGGQVQVRFKRVDGKEELAGILFLDDVTLRLDRYWLIPFRDRKSDLLVVKRGSVLYLQD